MRRPAGSAAIAATALLLTFAAFVALVAVLQVARTDLDWQRATLSLYLHGPHGLLLRAGYCALALAIALLGSMLYRGFAPAARSAAPLLLFVAAAAGLLGVAIGDSYLPARAPLLAPLVHGLAAQTAFLCVTSAMLLQSWRFRGDGYWRRLHPPAWWLAWLVFGLLWLHVLWRSAPRGLSQKVVIAGVLCWLLLVAWWLRRRPSPEAAAGAQTRENVGDIPPKEDAPC